MGDDNGSVSYSAAGEGPVLQADAERQGLDSEGFDMGVAVEVEVASRMQVSRGQLQGLAVHGSLVGRVVQQLARKIRRGRCGREVRGGNP